MNEIIELWVSGAGHYGETFELGVKGVEKITWSAGTSGVEYKVTYKDKIVQLRGSGVCYRATWRKA